MNPAPSLLTAFAVGSWYIPFNSVLSMSIHRSKIKEHREKVDALVTLLECRKRDEAPDDAVLNKLFFLDL